MGALSFFGQDISTIRNKVLIRSPLPTPETGWRPPRFFPNLESAYAIARDRETRELDFDNGPGWARGKGHVVGESITAYDSDLRPTTWYFPMRHEVEPEYNLDPDAVARYCADVDRLPQIKIYANGIYDIGYGLDQSRELPQGELHEVQFAEALLSETDLTRLDALYEKYLGRGKQTDALYKWCAATYGGEPTGKQRSNIYRTSPRIAGPYAEEDSAGLLPVLMQQLPKIREQGLERVYRMECDLIRLLVLMRKRGVRIDLEKAEKLYEEFGYSVIERGVDSVGIIADLERDLYNLCGVWCNTESSNDLAKAFDAVSVKYPRTPKTENGGGDNPSFTSEFLQSVEHPIAAKVINIRQHKKLRSTFLKSYILDSHYNGRVHGQYHPLKGDEGGTRVGRLSSSTPNLQNIPSRTALGRKIREMFLPDIGSLCLEKGDHSQLQYRILAHFAVDGLGDNRYGDGPSSNALRAEYLANPHTDYHTRTQTTVKRVSGLYIPRSSEESSLGQMPIFQPGTPEYDAELKKYTKAKKEEIAHIQFTPWGTGRFTIKEFNFGMMFGMGKKKIIRQGGFHGKDAYEKGENIYNAYHQGNPYVKATMDWMGKQAQRDGFIRTIMNRRTRFDEWVKSGFHDPPLKPLAYEYAIRLWGNDIERAGTFKALCNVLQGSEGEIIKMGMLLCFLAGVYDIIGVPSLTTHDEVVNDVADDTPATRSAFAEMRNIMQNVVAQVLGLRVPLVYESTRGPDWGNAKEKIDVETPIWIPSI